MYHSSAYKGYVEHADDTTDVTLGDIVPMDTMVEYSNESSDSDENFMEEQIRDVATQKTRKTVIPEKLKRQSYPKPRLGIPNVDSIQNDLLTDQEGSSVGGLLSFHRQNKRARKLNMDHVYINFFDFIWCSFFVTPPMVLGALIGGPCSSGIFGLLKNKLLRKLGLKRMMDPSSAAEKALVEFCLNSSMSTWITDVENLEDGSVNGVITIPGASHITKLSTVNSGTLRFVICLTSHKLVEATFQNQKLGAHDALALCFNAFGGHSHPLIHSYANWGVNPNATDPFVRRMALITIKYNNMGLESYPATMQCFRSLGLADFIDHDTTRLTCHMHHNVPSHAHLRGIQKYSEYLHFIILVRVKFLTEFQKHSTDFPGIDGEALFVGTVIHSIDHRQAAYCIDVGLFTSNNTRYDGDHEWAKVTSNCFIDKPPGRLFECRFSHAGHPFFKNVYDFAVTINPRLAGYMEACIAM